MVSTPESPGRRFEPTRRPHLVFPTLLIAIGFVLLLATTGAMSQDVSLRLLQLWPLVLVLIGLELILGWALPTAAGRMLTALLLLVLMVAAIAFAFSAPFRTGPVTSSDFTGQSGSIARPTLVLNLAGTNVQLEPAALGGDLYSTHFEIASGGRPDVALDRSTGRLTVSIQQQFGGFFNPWGTGDRVLVKLNQDIPWDIELNSAGTTTTADLSSVSLSSLRISGAGTRFTGTLPTAAGAVPVKVTGVGCNVTLAVPAGTPAVVGGGGILTTVNGNAVTGAGSSAASARDRYDIELSGVAATLTINEAQP